MLHLKCRTQAVRGITKGPYSQGYSPYNETFPTANSPAGMPHFQPQSAVTDKAKYDRIVQLEKMILDERLRQEAHKEVQKKETEAEAAKDEAIARLEKLILVDRIERENREAVRLAAIAAEAAEKQAREEQIAHDR
ncbi:hypothetical protein N7478_009799 [Penicillium angulare]|uniref:uncharacterized protein n=1 Tax=Penicillium angulare TaxID=116970 RepID=UPI0025417D1B|nr:uncharacterized protein N7478_009799 [Penicillium angulare]KAJ5266991.1 hypothetical protein N7478_009799 [Penicillium angulare]